MARSQVEIAGTDALFAELTARLGFEPQSYRGNVFSGHSTERLVDLVAKGRGVPDKRCRAVPWWFNGDFAPELLILGPDGYLGKGCGIAIGNIWSDVRGYRSGIV